MAKVIGPLMSLEARGKVADCLVFFPWKGLHVVRQLVTPSNPKSYDQGDQRMILGALGKACSVIGGIYVFASEIKGFALSGQTWVSTLIKYMIDNVIYDGDDWDSLWTEYNGHTAKAAFISEASALELPDFDVDYKGATNACPNGMILYLLAKYATNMHALNAAKFNRSPYTIALASWAEANIQAMVAEFSA